MKNLYIIIGSLVIIGAGAYFMFGRTHIENQSVIPAETTQSQNTTSAPSETIKPSTTPAPHTGEKTFTMADVAAHKNGLSCYTMIDGGVYDLTPFINQHPGGVVNIEKLCGIDGTALFTDQHGGQARPEQELASLKIGVLKK